jgi:hypothetical protein
MGLGTVERNRGAGRERRLDEKPGTAKIVSRHGGDYAILAEPIPAKQRRSGFTSSLPDEHKRRTRQPAPLSPNSSGF